MEIKNDKGTSILDYVNFGNGNASSSNNSSFDFQQIFDSSKTNDEPKFQKDSQKYYLKDEVNSVKNRISDRINKKENEAAIESNTLEADGSLIDKAKDKISEKIDDKINATKETTDVNEVADDVEISDEEKLAKLAEYLNISVDELKKTLEGLNMTIESLSNPENVKDFLIAINGLESRSDLLSVENIKEQLADIEAIANGDFEELSDEDTAKIVDAAIQSLETDESETSNESQTNSQTQSNAQSQNMSMSNKDTEANIEEESVNDEVEDTSNIKAVLESDDVSADEFVEEVEVDYSSEYTATNDVKETVASAMSAVATEQSIVAGTADSQAITGINGGLSTNTDNFLNEISKTQPRSSVDTDNILKQIAEAMKVELKGGLENEVRITLRPAHLGDVTLKIITENGIITAQFEAESQRVKEIIEANFNQLKNALEEQGVEVSSLEVNVSQHGESGNTGDSSDFNRNGSSNDIGGEFTGEDIIEEIVVEESQVLGSTSSFRA